MFLGYYEHSIDEKGRTTIPARYREQLDNGAFITRGFDQNLIVYTSEAFEKISQRVNRLSITDPAARDLRRLIFSHAERIEFDRAGRILIPQTRRDAAQLKDAAIIAGSGAHFELWAPSLWEAREKEAQNPEVIASHFASLDLTIE